MPCAIGEIDKQDAQVIFAQFLKHIVNLKTARGVKTITTIEGYKDMLIYPPSALVEEDEDDYE